MRFSNVVGEPARATHGHALGTLGVQASQFDTASVGNEKPVALGRDGAAWAQNRRADLAYGGRKPPCRAARCRADDRVGATAAAAALAASPQQAARAGLSRARYEKSME
ncbi:hypothetical protein XM57_25670 [Burkholderia cepacia]|nr:hypothetical protein XM57_25670 [Burkholderia cepacia]ETP63735.1 hypothetical protein BDSB_19735 [Burkholderia dolosa PC543]